MAGNSLAESAFDALAILKKAGCDLADIYLETARNVRVRIEDSLPNALQAGTETGAGLRLVRGQTTAYSSTTNITPEGLKTAARRLAQEADDGKATWSGESIGGAPPDTGKVSWEQRIQSAMAAEEAARQAGPHIRQVTVFLGTAEQKVGIARSDGLWCEDERRQAVLWVNAVAAEGRRIQTGYESAGGSQGWEFFERQDPETIGFLAGRRAEQMLMAAPAPSGCMPVVLAAEAGGTMIHEAVGHALEADLIHNHLSCFQDRLGQMVASPLVSVADDPTLPGWRGSFAFDDEGTPAQKNLLVDQGILVGYLYDRLTALHNQAKPTGNGRRQSYAHRPIPRMTNTMILPGTDDPAEIIRSVDKGLYIVRMGGGQVNTVNGDFVFEVNEGYWIRQGERAEPVRGATLIGSGPEILKIIDKVGNDLGLGIGTCGKEGQAVPVADAQPTLRIPEITIGGSGD